jgi:hypothetical protein
MSWSVSDRFPSWGETGESPGAGFFYEGGDQVNEKHLDYLWNSLKGLEDDVQAALTDIDNDSDGIVDEAATVTSGGSLQGDLQANNGEVIWDESANYIPQARLQNDSITVNGDTVALGGSTTVSTFSGSHTDLSNVSAGQHRSDSNIVTTVEGAGTLNVNISGDADTVDGSDANDLGASYNVNGYVPVVKDARTVDADTSETFTKSISATTDSVFVESNYSSSDGGSGSTGISNVVIKDTSGNTLVDDSVFGAVVEIGSGKEYTFTEQPVGSIEITLAADASVNTTFRTTALIAGSVTYN